MQATTTPKKRTLNRERIIIAAYSVLNKKGLDGMSLRLLAEELDVQAPALYKHFKNKDAVLIAMTQRLLDEWSAECEKFGEIGWQEWLTRSSQALRNILRQHRDSPRLFMMYHSYCETSLSTLILGTLHTQGFTPPESLSAVSMLTNFIIGFTLEEDFERHTEPIAPIRMAENIGPEFLEGAQDYDKQYNYALARIMRGLAH